MKNSSSEKITILRPLLIFLIVSTHIQGNLYRPDIKDIEFTVENFLHALLSGSIAISALPLLSIISGYLAGRTYQKYSYSQTIKSKTSRLLFPMIFWNLVLAIYIYQSQALGFPRRPDLMLYPFNIENWLYGLLSLFKLPANQPLYFLKELFLCFTILPILYRISKNPTATILFLCVIAFMSVSSINLGGFFHRIDIYGFFVVGLFIYNHQEQINKKSNLANKKNQYIFMFFYLILAIALTLYAFKKDNSNFIYYMKAMTVIGPLAFWLIGDYIRGYLKAFLKWLSPAAFPVFLGHILILNIYWDQWSGYFKATPITANYWIYWISSMVICYAVLGLSAVIYRKVLGLIKTIKDRKKKTNCS